jgi:O-methyltransferase involved in polyketide biosynthesis
MKKEKNKLSGVPETMLIPLWCKAMETEMPNGIIEDRRSLEIIAQIDYDFSRFQSAEVSRFAVITRTEIIDEMVTAYLKNQPEGTVINLGSGLDTRCSRLDNKKMRWIDVDLPEGIELRQQFFQEHERLKFIRKSVLDYSWMEETPREGVLLIAEGLFMYFEERQVKDLLCRLCDEFRNSEILLETLDPIVVRNSKRHDSITKIDSKVELKWGVKSARRIASWHQQLQFVDEVYLLDRHKDRLKPWLRLSSKIPRIRKIARISRFRIG